MCILFLIGIISTGRRTTQVSFTLLKGRPLPCCVRGRQNEACNAGDIPLSICTLTGGGLSSKRLLMNRRGSTHALSTNGNTRQHTQSLAWSSGIRRHASFPKDLQLNGVSYWSYYTSSQQIPFDSRMENKLGIKYIQY